MPHAKGALRKEFLPPTERQKKLLIAQAQERRERLAAVKEPVTDTCPTCLKSFLQPVHEGKRQKFCSISCATRFQFPDGPKGLQPRTETCAGCGELFDRPHAKFNDKARRFFCSRACFGKKRSEEMKEALRAAGALQNKQCPTCGRWFERQGSYSKGNVIYCSQSCASKAAARARHAKRNDEAKLPPDRAPGGFPAGEQRPLQREPGGGAAGERPPMGALRRDLVVGVAALSFVGWLAARLVARSGTEDGAAGT